MILTAADRRRLQELALEAKKILGGSRRSDGRAKSFAELEEECIEVGDLLTADLLQQCVAEQQPAAQAICPSCQQVGKPLPEEPRVLQTDRGEVIWNEPSYQCRRCRRAFFPSVG